MKNNKGFISMSLIYTFFLLFISILVYILGYYTHSIGLLSTLRADMKSQLQADSNYRWDQTCYNLSTRLNCKLLFKEAGTTVIRNKTPLIYADFEYPLLTEDAGLYYTEDELGPSYFYRGAVKNNFVQFAQDNLGNPLYWRIIRINGDGSIRLVYMGKSVNAAELVSDINTFYTSIKAEDQINIVSNNFCYQYQNASTSLNQTNILACQDSLSSLVGSVGYNEAIAAGAAYNHSTGAIPSLDPYDNDGYFLHANEAYNTAQANVIVAADGGLQNDVASKYRPVINLATNVKVGAGNGSKENPYIIAPSSLTKLLSQGNIGVNMAYEYYETGTLFIKGFGIMNDYISDNIPSVILFDLKEELDLSISELTKLQDNPDLGTLFILFTNRNWRYIGKSLNNLNISNYETALSALQEKYSGDNYQWFFDLISKIYPKFYGITSIVIDNGVETIGANAFEMTGNIEIRLPSSVKGITGDAFEMSSANIILNDGLISIGKRAFRNWTGTTMIIPNTVETIDDEAFQSSNLVHITLPTNPSFDRIHHNIFTECKKLTTIMIPENINIIPSLAFDTAKRGITFNLVGPERLISNGAGGQFNFTINDYYANWNYLQ